MHDEKNKSPRKNSAIIVTGGDAGYYPLLRDLIDSIRARQEGKNFPVGVLDGGLETEQVAEFRSQGIQVVKPDWPSDKTRKRAGARQYIVINLNKPRLDKWFPDYETLIWLDGDTWVQTWEGIRLFRQVAEKNKLAVVTKTSRLRPKVMRMSPRPFGWVRPRGFLYNNAKRAKLPTRIRRSLVNKSVFNAGAYAISKHSPHWERWRFWQNICMQKGRLFSSDQLSLALTVYEDNLPYEALPDICNYMGPWRVNRTDGMLLDYFAPYQPASIVHMAGNITPKTLAGESIWAVDENDNAIEAYLGYCPRKNRIK